MPRTPKKKRNPTLQELSEKYKKSVNNYIKSTKEKKAALSNRVQTDSDELFSAISRAKEKQDSGKNKILTEILQGLETFINAIKDSKLKEQQKNKFKIIEKVDSTNVAPTTEEAAKTNNGTAAEEQSKTNTTQVATGNNETNQKTPENTKNDANQDTDKTTITITEIPSASLKTGQDTIENDNSKTDLHAEDNGKKPNNAKDESLNMTVATTSTAIKTAENLNAAFISAFIGVIAGAYSGLLQNMLFGKIFIGKALLFGYAVPALNLIMASAVFGIVVFAAALTIVSIAKYAEDKTLFQDITTSSYFKNTLIALTAIVTCAAVTQYAVAIQLASFGTILLGGTLLTNIGFALIATAVIVAVTYITPHNFKLISTFGAFAAGTWFATPLLQALAGIAITGSTLTIVASSLAVGISIAALTYGLIFAAEKIINIGQGFGLTMYALSFAAMSMYTGPIQAALLSNGLVFMTPLLSSIFAVGIASFVTAIIVTTVYKSFEKLLTYLIGKDEKNNKPISQTSLGNGYSNPMRSNLLIKREVDQGNNETTPPQISQNDHIRFIGPMQEKYGKIKQEDHMPAAITKHQEETIAEAARLLVLSTVTYKLSSI